MSQGGLDAGSDMLVNTEQGFCSPPRADARRTYPESSLTFWAQGPDTVS